MAYVFLILGVLFIVYGALVSTAGSGTLFFLVWFALAAAAFILSLAVRHGFFSEGGGWLSLPPALRYAFTALVVLCFSVFIVFEALVLSGFDERGRPDLDYIIVLGAQVRREGPSTVLKYRLDCALEYLENNPETLCVLSGGQGYNEPWSEAEGMRRYLAGRGIAEERLILEDRSTNTIENIRNSMELLDPEKDSVGIVTNNFHVYRSKEIAKKQGIRDVEGIAAPSTFINLPHNMLREFVGMSKDVLERNMW